MNRSLVRGQRDRSKGKFSVGQLISHLADIFTERKERGFNRAKSYISPLTAD